MKAPVSHLDDSDMQAAPVALLRAAERARRLAEQTGTRFVVRTLPRLDGNEAEVRDGVPQEGDNRDASAPEG
jgi:hypothetical protein